VFPARKDASDLDLAVDAALARGASAIAVTAAFTNRLDHTLAAVGVAMRVPEDVDVAFRDPHFSAAVLRAPVEHALSLDVAPGSIISVIALTTATGVTLQGLEYPLACASLPALSSHGISNISQATRVSVSAEQGTLLVMHMEAGSQGSYSGASGPLPITRP
jgi:thiamine pyrophosphokinase